MLRLYFMPLKENMCNNNGFSPYTVVKLSCYWVESRGLQYFGKMRHNSAVPDSFP